MAGLCEGGNEPAGSLKAVNTPLAAFRRQRGDKAVRCHKGLEGCHKFQRTISTTKEKLFCLFLECKKS
ncbi:hypothetical protein ANN_01737 [Periplaneta americana]|uniref:Uncharacterized protein n=1 Tax=Periplaneta americana TaxID=6978 RepID=A0ABQ8TXA7_PERAM|nr:hypothetical protein ANN_01737 [Periplaneta americana]